MPTTPLFLFDADCGICQQGTDRIRETIAPPAEIVGYQSVDLDALGVSEKAVEEGPVLVRSDGTHVVGPRAMAELLASARSPYRQAGRVMLLPGVRQVLGAVGPVMYRNKHRLPGASDSCRVVHHAQPA
jgi:predicted DCC family thiol-disulfide oxidoreductase YuxK